jgi:hypothetical protein
MRETIIALAVIVAFLSLFVGLGMFIAYDNCRDYAAMGHKVHRGYFSCYVQFGNEWRRL